MVLHDRLVPPKVEACSITTPSGVTLKDNVKERSVQWAKLEAEYLIVCFGTRDGWKYGSLFIYEQLFMVWFGWTVQDLEET